MEVATFIDWLSITHFGSATFETHSALPKQRKVTRAHSGYTSALLYTSGAIEMWNENKPRMGRHFIYTGKVLQRIQEMYGVSRDEILRFHTTLQGRVARIDFAIDIKQSGLLLTDLWEALEGKNAVTLSGHSRTQSGGNKGDTVYVGSRKTRKKLLRMYDKAKELGDFLEDYKRVELEMRGNVAVNASHQYQDSGYLQSCIMGMVRKFCDFPSISQWSDIFQAEPVKIPVGTHKTGDTEAWLLRQVAPALARAMLDDGSFYSRFIEHVQFHYNFMLDEQEFGSK